MDGRNVNSISEASRPELRRISRLINLGSLTLSNFLGDFIRGSRISTFTGVSNCSARDCTPSRERSSGTNHEFTFSTEGGMRAASVESQS